MKLPAYPHCKSSGVEWLGQVPEHWEAKRLKYSASINDEALPETTDPGYDLSYVDISSVDAVRGIGAIEEMSFEEAPSRARRIVRDGDTIVSTVRTYLRAIAPIRAPRENMIVSTGFAVIRPRRIQPEFMSYAVREAGFVDTIVARSVGVSYPAVNASEIGMIPVPLPPAEEQRAIADFLGRETAKIDTLVAKKRTLIERLKEKHTALISHTVTRGLPPDAARAAGLDPHPKLKSSGIDWLGDVPEHWGLGRVSGLFRLRSGGTPSTDVEAYWEGDIPWVSAKDMKCLRVAETEDHITLRAVTESATSIVPAGTVLIVARSGILKHTLPVAVTERQVAINQDIKGLLPDTERIEAFFFAYWVQGSQLPLLTLWRQQGATVESLDVEKVKTTAIPLPPLDEQRAITDFLDRKTAKIDGMVTKVGTAIERLQEYRTALITSAVTGKIDVRGAVA